VVSWALATCHICQGTQWDTSREGLQSLPGLHIANWCYASGTNTENEMKAWTWVL